MKLNIHGVDDTMRQRVNKMLDSIEREHDVKVLFACESGSRGWGFASPDSDYDVRFLYVHRPEWYLKVEPQRDVIERPISDELDISGWEWRKALGLLKRANPTLIEWQDSPIIYREDTLWMNRLRQTLPQFFSPLKARYHYLSMAQRNFKEHLQGDSIRLKKYLYVLRPLLAVKWIDEGKGIPPMPFGKLLAGSTLPAAAYSELENLLDTKQQAGESHYGPCCEQLHAFIARELDDAARRTDIDPAAYTETAALDRLLFETVMAQSEPR